MLDRINEIILEQEGEEVTLDSRLKDSGMDSFSYAFFWAYIQDEYPEFTDPYINSIDYDTYTLRDMVNHHENN